MDLTPQPPSFDKIAERSRARRDRMVGQRARSFQEADDWDLDYWQSQGAEARLSALVALRKEVDIVGRAREIAHGHGPGL